MVRDISLEKSGEGGSLDLGRGWVGRVSVCVKGLGLLFYDIIRVLIVCSAMT